MTRSYYYSSYHDYLQYFSFPVHFLVFLTVVFLCLVFKWYLNYDSYFEDFIDYFKIFLMIFPVLLLLLVHFMSRGPYREYEGYGLPEKDTVREGASPVGVGILLIFLMFMISHHSSFKEKWFPLFYRK